MLDFVDETGEYQNKYVQDGVLVEVTTTPPSNPTLELARIELAAGEAAPEAVFIKGGRRLRLALRPEIWKSIRAGVAAATKKYGSLTPEYFNEIRRLSIRYWLELDRREIFIEEERETGTDPR